MPDIMDELASKLRGLLGNADPEVVISPAPGGGPESDREGNRTEHSGRIGTHITRGRDALGYGGHGDALTVTADLPEDVQAEIDKYVNRSQRKGLAHLQPKGKIRLAIPVSLEAHCKEYQSVSGPFSLFDGTISAPGAGNSVQQIPISLPTNIPSPVLLLDRYPGAMYMSIFVHSFAFCPTGTTGTGLQECWFSDVGGATCALGIYSAASQTAGDFQRINSLLTTPINDPGNVQMGTLTVNNVGIGGTPTTVRYQLALGYVAMVPDPWFNEQVMIPPLPSEIAQYLRTGGAQGN